ncbi:MAG: CPBP family intramembrane glutamic endopeptidase, partial [Planctomycetota bacterium]|nr:CPBP family intramembrane glutamic endopeptidase [Planctomycetota bacterium]
SLLFGACHALSKTYFLLTFIIGIYFGYLVELTGSVLPAALSHAGYDFVALIYLMTLDNQLRQQERKEVIEDGEGPADSMSVEDLEKESTNQ